jgi:hypothetical protein
MWFGHRLRARTPSILSVRFSKACPSALGRELPFAKGKFRPTPDVRRLLRQGIGVFYTARNELDRRSSERRANFVSGIWPETGIAFSSALGWSAQERARAWLGSAWRGPVDESGSAPGVVCVARMRSSASKVPKLRARVPRLLATLAAMLAGFTLFAFRVRSPQQCGVRECAKAGVASSSSAAIPACNSPSAAAGSSANWNSARSSRLIMPCRTRASKLMISFQ